MIKPSTEYFIRKDVEAVDHLASEITLYFASIRLRKENHRSSVFVWEFLDAIAALVQVAQAEAMGELHPNYAIEKIDKALRYITTIKEYFEAVDDAAQTQAEIARGK